MRRPPCGFGIFIPLLPAIFAATAFCAEVGEKGGGRSEAFEAAWILALVVVVYVVAILGLVFLRRYFMGPIRKEKGPEGK